MIKNYRDIRAYKNSKKLFPVIVKITKNFPIEGRELASQLRRSANSIHANIAEGFGKSEKDFKRYLQISLGSCDETISHLDDVKNCQFAKGETIDKLIEFYSIVGKQIYKLRKNWKKF